CYYKQNHQHVICASPERFLRKTNQTLISQPIKGTSKRNLENPIEDTANKTALLDSAKERSENVMVVDLVRNDLSKICTEGSVEVEELFGIYSFPQVHQMISTIKGTLNNTTDFLSIINATFPMGSMTGAPKKKVLELIHTYEKSNRGLYSGAVGYITPTRDFDFNVVIRSILYNSQNNYLSYHVGSGITFNSNPEKEYEECILKASAMVTVLTATNS
ncbi:MAG: chorismate-binding protein, partial [Chitinophagaceae bacterium]